LNGEILWRFKTAQQVFSSPAVVGDRVYCGEGLHSDFNSSLYCLDATSGTQVWAFQTKSHVESTPVVMDGRVWFGAGDDGVYCVDADEGTTVWHFEGVHVDVAPAVDTERVYFGTGYGNQGMYAADRDNGDEVWNVKTDYGAWGTPSVDGDDLFYAIGNGNFVESAPEGQRFGRVICCEARTGDERWHYDTPDAVLSAIAVADTRVYFGCRDKNVYCLDRKTGDLVWQRPTGGPVVCSPTVDGARVYVGSDDGKMWAFDAASGEVAWIYDTKRVTGRETHIWSSPALARGRLFFGSSSSYIFCVGHVKKQPDS
jgi:outer membrane protein assembly factor BamB